MVPKLIARLVLHLSSKFLLLSTYISPNEWIKWSICCRTSEFSAHWWTQNTAEPAAALGWILCFCITPVWAISIIPFLSLCEPLQCPVVCPGWPARHTLLQAHQPDTLLCFSTCSPHWMWNRMGPARAGDAPAAGYRGTRFAEGSVIARTTPGSYCELCTVTGRLCLPGNYQTHSHGPGGFLVNNDFSPFKLMF